MRKWMILAFTGGMVFQTSTSCQGQIMDLVLSAVITSATSALSTAISDSISGALDNSDAAS
jgi:hypothetical protein